MVGLQCALFSDDELPVARGGSTCTQRGGLFDDGDYGDAKVGDGLALLRGGGSMPALHGRALGANQGAQPQAAALVGALGNEAALVVDDWFADAGDASQFFLSPPAPAPAVAGANPSAAHPAAVAPTSAPLPVVGSAMVAPLPAAAAPGFLWELQEEDAVEAPSKAEVATGVAGVSLKRGFPSDFEAKALSGPWSVLDLPRYSSGNSVMVESTTAPDSGLAKRLRAAAVALLGQRNGA